MWVAISAVLLTIMRSKGFGLTLLTALSWEALVIAGFAFVDDTDLIHSARHPNTSSEQVLQESQEALDTWEGSLRDTGGAIGADDESKAFWYFLDFAHKEPGWYCLNGRNP